MNSGGENVEAGDGRQEEKAADGNPQAPCTGVRPRRAPLAAALQHSIVHAAVKNNLVSLEKVRTFAPDFTERNNLDGGRSSAG